MSKFKVGDKVNYISMVTKKVVSSDHEITHIELQPNNYGCDVAWLTNKAGCADFEALTHQLAE